LSLPIKRVFKKDFYEASYQVPPEQDGMRFDSFLQQFYPTFSREDLKNRIRRQEIVIIGRPTPSRPCTKVHTGETVKVQITKTKQEDEYWNGNKIQLVQDPDILYQDENLVVISKPPFMSTHPTGRHVFYCATVYLESHYNLPVHSVHRLDRETSGVLILAKTPRAAAEITSYFEHNKMQKCYFFIAKVDSTFNGENEFSCRHRLCQGDKSIKRIFVESHPPDSTEGKSALTHFKILRHSAEYALGLAFPRTGRQHQIRVHAKIRGLPLVGDKLYLGSYAMFQHFKDRVASQEEHDLMEMPRQALHALALYSPYKGGALFRSSIPLDFQEWIKEKMPHIKVSDIEKEIDQILKVKFSP